MKNGLKIIFVLLLAACSSSKSSSPVLATVNDWKITVADFQKAMEMEQWKFGSEMGVSGERLKQLKIQVMEGLLKECLLLQESQKRQIIVSEAEVEKGIVKFKSYYSQEEDFEKMLELRGLSLKDFKAQRVQEIKIQKLMEQITAEQMALTREELRHYYETHLEEFKHTHQVHARQIVTDAKEKAEALRTMLSGGAPFEEVAKKYSLSPDRKQGGDLGWFGKGMMPQEFDQVCFELQDKEFSAVVKTPYGYHLFQVLEKRGAGQFPFDEVEGEIRKKLIATNGREAFQKWYEALRAQANIEVKTDLLEGSP